MSVVKVFLFTILPYCDHRQQVENLFNLVPDVPVGPVLSVAYVHHMLMWHLSYNASGKSTRTLLNMCCVLYVCDQNMSVTMQYAIGETLIITSSLSVNSSSASFENALFLESNQFSATFFFGADWKLHQREHEDRNGSTAAERRPQPHSSHVGNGHQPSFSDGWTDTQAYWCWDAGNTLKNTHSYALKHVNGSHSILSLCLSQAHKLLHWEDPPYAPLTQLLRAQLPQKGYRTLAKYNSDAI